ncbi:hypothetical protein [Streptomyces zingiberis]|uniref:DUF317 domain-containing protein n=1 Tax=Streptomyces zingiberis TaxID=2053010 RepID=A0ABX1C3K7_9ACTN|nr:hypothetical protein [Streptomyces zingiberis]NJQ02502.1 hypothetical protein [Streptomyces zingiberis]
MESSIAPSAAWRPPIHHEMQRVGIHWDAVRAPSYLGDRALALLGDVCGGVIGDGYLHRVIWLVPPGTAARWDRLPAVDVYGPACWLEVPSAGHTRGRSPFWKVEPTPRLHTDPEQLHTALNRVIAETHGPRTAGVRAAGTRQAETGKGEPGPAGATAHRPEAAGR